MLALWVKVRVKAEERERFLKAIETDALGSERDEPSCLRFNVFRDQQDQNVYYFFEVYRDQAALAGHIVRRRITLCGVQQRTRSMGRPRQRAAIQCFLPRADTGRNVGFSSEGGGIGSEHCSPSIGLRPCWPVPRPCFVVDVGMEALPVIACQHNN